VTKTWAAQEHAQLSKVQLGFLALPTRRGTSHGT